MNAKQNALEILRFGRPERVTSGLPCHDVSYFGVDHESPDGGGGHHLPVGSSWTDLWGTTWHREHDGVMGYPRGNPIDSLAALRQYRWPDPDDERWCGRVGERAAQQQDADAVFVAGRHRDTLWEKAYLLCGMERMMQWFLCEPAAAREVLHRIMDFQLGMARHYLAHGIEVAHCGDDLGTQRGLLLSPRLIAEFLVPEYRRLCDLYRQQDVLISFHSCGHIEPLLPTFIDLGVTCLNPVQASANDLAAVRQATQAKLALQGGVPSGLLVSGPPAAIRAEVARCLWLLGRDGGYFCAPDQGLPWPAAHYAAYEQAVAELGEYPLAPADG